MSTKNNELSRITIDIPKIDHKKLKALAALLGTSMRELIIESIEERLAKQREEAECPYDHTPNEETLRVIRNVKQGKNLVRAKDMKDLRKKLGV